MTTYFNVKDFADIQLSKNFAEDRNCQVYNASAQGKQDNYDVFISHSSRDKDLIKKLRIYLEDQYHLSAYIDWNEDSGMSREEVADTVKNAMSHSKTFLIVKTDNSDQSSWVSWETGCFEMMCTTFNDNNFDRIGVLLIEDDSKAFNKNTFLHQEYLKRYEIIGKDELIDFVAGGRKKILENRRYAENILSFDKDFRSASLKFDHSIATLKTVTSGSGTTTSFYGD